MKKKLLIISIIFIIFAGIIGTIIYSQHEAALEKEQEQKKAQQEALLKSGIYCFITYQLSSDNGKTWHKVVINSGEKPIYKAQCWKKYIHLLDGFKASADADGKWFSKTKDGKIISQPSMHFSDTPFQPKQDKKEDSKDKLAKQTSSDQSN